MEEQPIDLILGGGVGVRPPMLQRAWACLAVMAIAIITTAWWNRHG